MVNTFKGELVNCHGLYISKVIFYVFQNRSISFSYVLNLLQNSSVNHVFSIVFETSSNCSRNMQMFTSLKSMFCPIIQNTAKG